VRLIGQVITVSQETMKIIKALLVLAIPRRVTSETSHNAL
jgi:hypothetical protein